MVRSYLTTAFRFLWRQKAYSSINVLGLSVGLACSFFILLWVQDEVGYDRFHEEGDRLYRVMRNVTFSDGQIFTWSAIPYPLAQVLEDDFADVSDAILTTWEETLLFANGDQAAREKGRHFGPALFEAFSFPLLQGDPATVLADPNTVVISETLAEKYFGPDWPTEAVGRTLRVENQWDLTVAGVFADIPENSTLRFDFAIPVEEFYQRNGWLDHWGNNSLRLFVRLHEGADPAAVNDRIANVIMEHHESSAPSVLFLQPYGDVHLYSDFKDGRLVGGRIEYVRLFALVALAILLIASINFMNLATARSSQRAREIGVRKSVGATQGSLVRQFLGESVVLASLAFVLALGMVVVGLPGFNALTGKHVTPAALDRLTVLAFLGIALVTGLIAGSYPALYLSSFNVIAVLRNTVARRAGGAGMRKGLVIFQFAMSILLIIGTMTVYRQIDYIRTKNLGMNKENLVYLRLEGNVQEQYAAFKQELMQQPGIAGVTISSSNPLSIGQSTSDPEWDGKAPDSGILFHIINTEYDFLETMKMELVAGRAFSRDFGADSLSYVINERAAEAMGMDDPIGQRLAFWGREGTIVGVVRDFHMTSLYEAIEPTILRFAPEDTWMLFVRTEAGRTQEALAGLERVYTAFNTEYPFEYQFVDETYEQQYQSEIVIGKLANTFAVLAVFIACLGLFGLASFTAEQRTKEIGIRKVLGASVGGLVLLLSRDFVTLVFVAFVLAAPAAYYLMEQWLGNFAYHTDLSWSLFAAAGLAALLIAWGTVSYQSVRAALANPARSLRTE